MRDIGLLFADEMVRAYLEGRKTQTRRPIKWAVNQVGEPADHLFQIGTTGRWIAWWGLGTREQLQQLTDKAYRDRDGFRAPCHAGDQLVVRECARLSSMSGSGGIVDTIRLLYREGNELLCPTHHREDPGPYDFARWTPSIHMPRWAARLVLPILSVRVQRVRDITPEDCRAEGSYWATDPDDERGFVKLWDSIYGHRHPFNTAWCWVIETEPYRGTER